MKTHHQWQANPSLGCKHPFAEPNQEHQTNWDCCITPWISAKDPSLSEGLTGGIFRFHQKQISPLQHPGKLEKQTWDITQRDSSIKSYRCWCKHLLWYFHHRPCSDNKLTTGSRPFHWMAPEHQYAEPAYRRRYVQLLHLDEKCRLRFDSWAVGLQKGLSGR